MRLGNTVWRNSARFACSALSDPAGDRDGLCTCAMGAQQEFEALCKKEGVAANLTLLPPGRIYLNDWHTDNW